MNNINCSFSFQVTILTLLGLVLNIGCGPTNKVTETEIDTPQVLLITLKKKATVQELEKAFSLYQLQMKKRVNKTKPQYSFTARLGNVDTEAFLTKLKSSPLVATASYPKALDQPRVTTQNK